MQAAGPRLAPHTSAPGGSSGFFLPWGLLPAAPSASPGSAGPAALPPGPADPKVEPRRRHPWELQVLLAAGGWARSALAHQLFLEEVAFSGDITGATRNSVRGGFAHLTDSDLCMAEWHRSSFGPNLTDLAGSLTLACGLRPPLSCLSGASSGRRWWRGWSAAGPCWRWARPVSVRGPWPRPLCWGSSPAEWRAGALRGPTKGSGSFSGPAPCCPPGLDGHSSEAGRTRAWDRAGAVALPGAGCVSGAGVFSKTVAF